MSDVPAQSVFARADAGAHGTDAGELFEIANGQVIEQEPMGAYEAYLASFLQTLIDSHARAQKLGRSVSEVLFKLSAGLQRRPDVAYVSYKRWPRHRRVPRANAWDVVPDIAVEVVSSTNTFEEVVGKVREYFAAGSQRVWVIAVSEQRIYVYHSPDDIRVIAVNDDLRNEDLLPGLSIALGELFDVEAVEDSLS